MDKELKEIIDAINVYIKEGRTCPAFLESEWEDLANLWDQLTQKVED